MPWLEDETVPLKVSSLREKSLDDSEYFVSLTNALLKNATSINQRGYSGKTILMHLAAAVSCNTQNGDYSFASLSQLEKIAETCKSLIEIVVHCLNRTVKA